MRKRIIGVFFILFISIAVLFVPISFSVAAVKQKSILSQAYEKNSQNKKPQYILADVFVNGVDNKTIVLLVLLPGQKLLISKTDMMKIQIKPMSAIPVEYNMQTYYSLTSMPGVKYKLDTHSDIIYLTIPAKYFSSQKVSIHDNYIKPNNPASGVYVDYDANLQRIDDQNSLGVFFTPVVFTAFGSLSSGFVFRQREYNDSYLISHGYQDTRREFIRLNSYWQKDFPARRATLILGDTYNVPGAWGRSVGYGGLHWGTNFSTQPYLTTYPLPSIAGDAVLPSTVDLYANQQLLNRQKFDRGPFTISSIPVVNGYGVLTTVVTDVLGRQRVINVPYYLATQLLKQNLVDYSLDMGFIRRNFSLNSNDYGRFFTVANYRRGITNYFTFGGRVEASSQEQNLGLSGTYLLSTLGQLDYSLAGSHSLLGAGGLFKIGFQRQVIRGLTVVVSTQITSHKFMQLGYDIDNRPPIVINQILLGKVLRNGSSLGLSYTQNKSRDSYDYKSISASYSQNLFYDLHLSLAGTVDLSKHKNNAISLILTKIIDDRHNINFSGLYNDDRSESTISLDRRLPTGPGFGYNLSVGHDKNTNYSATGSAQSNIGTYSASVSRQYDQMGYRAEALGSVVFMNGGPYLTRNIGSSFALVQIPGFANKNIYLWNNLIGRTNRHGYFFVPNLNPYEKNEITIDPNNFPINVQISKTKITAVPYYKNASLAYFPVHKINGAIMKLKLPSDKNVPIGSIINVNGIPKHFIVAQDGMAYLTDLQSFNKAQVSWYGNKCYFNFSYKETANPLPNLGTKICIPEH